jgi:hypothetical protein
MQAGSQFLDRPLAAGWSMPGLPADLSVPETGAAPGVGQPQRCRTARRDRGGPGRRIRLCDSGSKVARGPASWKHWHISPVSAIFLYTSCEVENAGWKGFARCARGGGPSANTDRVRLVGGGLPAVLTVPETVPATDPSTSHSFVRRLTRPDCVVVRWPGHRPDRRPVTESEQSRQ